jgi:hypothetical protein
MKVFVYAGNKAQAWAWIQKRLLPTREPKHEFHVIGSYQDIGHDSESMNVLMLSSAPYNPGYSAVQAAINALNDKLPNYVRYIKETDL